MQSTIKSNVAALYAAAELSTRDSAEFESIVARGLVHVLYDYYLEHDGRLTPHVHALAVAVRSVNLPSDARNTIYPRS